MEALGIKPLYLIAQIVNFLILLVILKKFLYKPILEVLDKRRERIKEGLKKAERVEQEFKKIEEKKAQEIKRAEREAQKIKQAARRETQEMKAEITSQAQEEAAKIRGQALAGLEEEKKKMMKEFRTQAGQLVLSTTNQVLKQSLDTEKQRKLIKSILEDMKEMPKMKK